MTDDTLPDTIAERAIRRIESIAYHRNGVSGEPFYVVTFRPNGQGAKPHRFVAVVFDTERSKRCRVAVLDIELAAQGVIEFGKNSWRGDRYEQELREAIKQREACQRQVERDREPAPGWAP